MGAKSIAISPKEEIICPNCPLTPIINLFLNEDSKLTCEFRCPNMHFGHIPFRDLFKYKNTHGNKCHWCNNDFSLDDKNVKNSIKEELLYCGTCKEFMCSKCRPIHDKDKESHKMLIKKSFYFSFVFLLSISYFTYIIKMIIESLSMNFTTAC